MLQHLLPINEQDTAKQRRRYTVDDVPVVPLDEHMEQELKLLALYGDSDEPDEEFLDSDSDVQSSDSDYSLAGDPSVVDDEESVDWTNEQNLKDREEAVQKKINDLIASRYTDYKIARALFSRLETLSTVPKIPSNRTIKYNFNANDTERVKHNKKITNVYVCGTCQKCHSSLFELEKHKMLTSHTRSHTAEKPYHCDICNKKFSLKCNLKSHIRIHTRNKGSKTRTNRRSRTISDEKPDQCNGFAKVDSTRNDLKRCRRTYTGDEPIDCQICKRQATVEQNRMRTKVAENAYNLCE